MPVRAPLVLSAIVGAAIWMGALVYLHAVEVPFLDSWRVAQHYAAYKNSTLTLADLYAPHNGHRPFVPMLLFVANFAVFDWWMLATLMLNIVMAMATALMLVFLVGRTVEVGTCLYGLLGAVITLQIFNQAQFVNWLKDFNTCWFIFNACAVAFFLCLHLGRERYIVVSGVAALGATYSIASGLLLWPIGLVYLLFNRARRALIVAWVAVSVLVFTAYYWDIRRVNPTRTATEPFTTPLAVIEFTVRFLGLTLQDGYVLGGVLVVVAGIAGVLSLAADLRQRAAPWLGLGAFIALSAVSAAFIRAPNFGAQAGSSSRYATAAALFVIAVSVMLAIVGNRWSRYRGATTGVILMIGLASALRYPEGYAQFHRMAQSFTIARSCLLEKGPQDECLSRVENPKRLERARSGWNAAKAAGWPGSRD